MDGKVTTILDTNSLRIAMEGPIMVVSFKMQHLDFEESRDSLSSRLKLTENRYLPLLVDISSLQSITKEARDHLSTQGFEGINALALLYSNPLNRMIASLFLGTADSTVPIKLFSDRKEALTWLYHFTNEAPPL